MVHPPLSLVCLDDGRGSTGGGGTGAVVLPGSLRYMFAGGVTDNYAGASGGSSGGGSGRAVTENYAGAGGSGDSRGVTTILVAPKLAY